jgi:hypothetical protein
MVADCGSPILEKQAENSVPPEDCCVKREGCCGSRGLRRSVPHSEYEHLKFAFEQLLPQEAAEALKEMEEQKGESGGVMSEALNQLDETEREELLTILHRKAAENTEQG